MPKKSLQQIEDFYINLGHKGVRLRDALTKDKVYQDLLAERRAKLTSQFKVSPVERKKYVLSTDADFEILARCKKLEELDLAKEEKALIKLIKTQLEDDWRKPLVDKLNQLLERYK